MEKNKEIEKYKKEIYKILKSRVGRSDAKTLMKSYESDFEMFLYEKGWDAKTSAGMMEIGY